jgi:uncharacterized membrane protein YhaH (DUF805 family)
MQSIHLAAALISFKGRSNRIHYWFGQLFFFMAYWFLTISMQRLAEAIRADRGPGLSSAGLGPFIAATIFFLTVFAATFYISFALTVRRWHDRDKSWTSALLGFVPIVGWAWQGVECGFLMGVTGPNRYGPAPKGVTDLLLRGRNANA